MGTLITLFFYVILLYCTTTPPLPKAPGEAPDEIDELVLKEVGWIYSVEIEKPTERLTVFGEDITLIPKFQKRVPLDFNMINVLTPITTVSKVFPCRGESREIIFENEGKFCIDPRNITMIDAKELEEILLSGKSIFITNQERSAGILLRVPVLFKLSPEKWRLQSTRAPIYYCSLGGILYGCDD